MARRIAVEEGLQPVNDFLRQQGYEVITWDGENLQGAEALVLTGADDNVMGLQKVETGIPVISAEGRSAEEVAHELRQRLRR